MSNRQVVWLTWLSCCISLSLLRTVPAQSANEQLSDAIAAIPNTPSINNELLKNQLTNYIRISRDRYNQESSRVWKSIRSREDWEAFRDSQIKKLSLSLNQSLTAPRNLRSQISKRIEFAQAGFAIENVVYESRPGLWVSANLYRPMSQVASAPGIIISHAHHTPKEHRELQDMGMTWARAGSYVLVPDHFGHGERRQHPLVSSESYPGTFRVSRQDYYFRYDLGIKLHLLGESLMGWLSWDISRGVDYLMQLPNIDPQRIILLGAVAGGGDPCAVTAALDQRIAVAVPFNFGGPQPETRYPLPDDVETSFNYAGGGSWESTRNLTRSAADGFLPWVIVGAVAPRKLIYAHEFNWDQDRDPVWKRLQAIYRFYSAEESLTYTHGRGELRGEPPEATHCTHIGAFHRERIHVALRNWFGIQVRPQDEYSSPVEPANLRCFPSPATTDGPNALADFRHLAQSKVAVARSTIQLGTVDERRSKLQTAWTRILGRVSFDDNQKLSAELRKVVRATSDARIEQVFLRSDEGIEVPVTLLQPIRRETKSLPIVLAFSHRGRHQLLTSHADRFAHWISSGVAVCIVDVRATGEGQVSSGRGRTSSSTGVSSSLLMLNDPLLAGQLRDVRTVLRWLETRADIDSQRLIVWGDSSSATATSEQLGTMPRDDDAALPPNCETNAALLALLLALYDDPIASVCISGGLASFVDAMDPQQVRIPHDCVVPGFFSTGDVADLVANVASRIPVRMERMVDGLNRPLSAEQLQHFKSYVLELANHAVKLRVDVDTAESDWFVRSAQR